MALAFTNLHRIQVEGIRQDIYLLEVANRDARQDRQIAKLQARLKKLRNGRESTEAIMHETRQIRQR